MARDITVTFEDGSTHVYKGAPDNVTPEEATKRAETEFGKAVKGLDGGRGSPPSAVSETAKVLGKSLYGGLTSIPRLVMEGGNYLEKQFPTPDALKIPIPGYDMAAALDERIRGAVEPETRAGKVFGNIGEAAVGAVAGPGGMTAPIKNALIGAGSGTGAEVAGAVTDDNAIARLIGALAGGGGTAALTTQVPNSTSMMKEAVRGVLPEDWTAAKAAQKTLTENQVPHLVSQLLGPSSSLDDVVMQASSHPQVRPTLLNATRDVAPKAQSAMEIWKSGNLPPAVEERRGLLLDVQKSAKQADRDTIQRANKAYEDVMPIVGEYSGDKIDALKKTLTDLANSDKYGPTSEGGKAILRFIDDKLPKAGKDMPAVPSAVLDATGNPASITPATAGKSPPMDMLHLNNLIKDLNTLSVTEGWKGLPVGDLKKILKEATPEFDAARAAKRAVMEAEVEPMRQGLAGDIARMGGGPNSNKYTVTGDVLKMVFPVDKAQPQAIRALAKDVGTDQVGHIFREHLTRSMEMASKGLDHTQNAPAKFIEAIAGTPAQRANIETAIDLIGQGQGNKAAVKRGFYELLHAFGTYKDLKIAPGVSSSNLQFEAGKNIPGMVVATMSRASRYLWEKATAKTYQKIADLVTSPEGLKELEKIARTPDQKAKGALLRGIITSTLESDSE